MKNTDLKQQLAKLTSQLRGLGKYALVGFLLLVAAVYGFVLYRIQTVSNEQPADTAINSQVAGANVPHIDQSIVSQLQSLHDNSVSVQGLFDQARNNPFQ